jgi:hypothetical protein
MIFSTFVAAFVTCVAFRMESGVWTNRNGWYWMIRVSVNQGRPTVLWQRSTPVILGCWLADGMWKNMKWCASPPGLCPQVGDPCGKRNYALNQSLGTLQLLCTFCCYNLRRANVPWQGMGKWKSFTCSNLSITITVIANSGELVLSTVPCSVFILCVLRLPINWVNYIYGRVILYGR